MNAYLEIPIDFLGRKKLKWFVKNYENEKPRKGVDNVFFLIEKDGVIVYFDLFEGITAYWEIILWDYPSIGDPFFKATFFPENGRMPKKILKRIFQALGDK